MISPKLAASVLIVAATLLFIALFLIPELKKRNKP
jgi:hypothetical protein